MEVVITTIDCKEVSYTYTNGKTKTIIIVNIQQADVTLGSYSHTRKISIFLNNLSGELPTQIHIFCNKKACPHHLAIV